MADFGSVEAIIENGKVVNAGSEKDKAKSTAPAGYDKDAFMQILVAQMKYQDPMEPTSNTEYISQYATFTQVEQLSNMASAMSMSRASEMVGKTVVITQTNSDTGKTSEVQGMVDYVTYSGNKAYLNIDGTNYNADDVSRVLADDYVNAIDTVKDFQKNIDKLPNLEFITDEKHGSTIDTMYEYYMNVLDDKAKKMMSNDYVTSLLQYVNKIDELRGNDKRTLTEDT
ncbi:flagellar basal-body rod modification protein FlgD [Butyrivibrio proteoclasticus]|uniref:Basal-body rod modification protein FlgD n=1 Tax=Butyrivibrio proteoclasticus TaxID=43305 RepID=A0A1I5QIL1_9FIRM|nr:flagellar hook capping FlgD N-terminal domain-containing protein [Butyrivibrio proteoclasticus]SFP45947.1 flagellar basal-body rod modification protein FlgD [Butyrivibrio proteoclasticus]